MNQQAFLSFPAINNIHSNINTNIYINHSSFYSSFCPNILYLHHHHYHHRRRHRHHNQIHDSVSSSASSTQIQHPSSSSYSSRYQPFPLQNDLLLRVARSSNSPTSTTTTDPSIDRTPVWLFRQAGRHLPEYNQLKKERGLDFLAILNDPLLVAQVTMQPIDRYRGLDAAILFSDILVVAEPFNIRIAMNKGIQVLNPCSTDDPTQLMQVLEDWNKNVAQMPGSNHSERLRKYVATELAHVIQAVRNIKDALKGKVPLLGFSAAPWTLLFYILGASSKKNQHMPQLFMQTHPKEATLFLDALTDTVIEYLGLQIENGADAIQLFEAMGAHINQPAFQQFAHPAIQKIATTLRNRYPEVPLMVFARGASYALPYLQTAGFNVVTIDTETDFVHARNVLSQAAPKVSNSLTHQAALQGNFTPAWLVPDDPKQGPQQADRDRVIEKTRLMLNASGPHKLIANLGEGLNGNEHPDLVQLFLDQVQQISSQLIKNNYLKDKPL